MVYVGQRWAMQIALPLAALAWLGHGLAGQVWVLHVARFVIGVVTGFLCTGGSSYILETSHASSRGMLYGMVQTIRQCGMILPYLLGYLDLGWRMLAFLCGLSFIVPFVGLFFMPDSPRWLATRKRNGEASKALQFLRGEKFDASSELNDILYEASKSEKVDVKVQVKLLTMPHILKPFLVINLLTFMSVVGGVNVLTVYGVVILQNASGFLTPYSSTVFLLAMRILAFTSSLFIIDRYGRKPILYVTLTICTMGLFGFGFIMILSDFNIDTSAINWLPMVCVISFCLAIGFAFPVLFILQGELVPTPVRAIGFSMVTLIGYIASFVSIATYPFLAELLGVGLVFMLFALINLAMILLVWRCIPETGNKSLEELTCIADR